MFILNLRARLWILTTSSHLENECANITPNLRFNIYMYMIIEYEKFLESKDKFPNLKKIKIDDFDIIIGRDAESNDYLTNIMADQNDIWFHTKGIPGSHVILKINNKMPDLRLIKKVAEICAKNSKTKDAKIIKVVYCKIKFVKKHSYMKVGQVEVDYKNAGEIEVSI